jgi:histidinol dehydrogenase
MKTAPIENHREREKGLIVYPVYSRRSGGLSVGINLFPARKSCSFDCPYCEVFPFACNPDFSLEQMEAELRAVIVDAQEQGIPVKDICFSGNGEPSRSAAFPAALQAAGRVRDELVPAAALVLITNGTGLLEPGIFTLLWDAACGTLSLRVWLKLDAGTPAWYAAMNRCRIPFETLTAAIERFTARAPAFLQTMVCAVDGKAPPPEEARGWEALVVKLALGAASGTPLYGVQIYGKARPAPEDPKAQALPAAVLEERAASLRRSLGAAFSGIPACAPPVEVYP